MARALSRRTFLRGAGAAVALPFLDAMLPAFARAQATATAKRLLCWYVPCGIYMEKWTPAETGAAFELPPVLAPLAPVRDDVLVLSGLANRAAIEAKPADHPRGTGCFLTCTPIKRTDGRDLHNGISVDQVVAQAIGRATSLPSLQLGAEGGGSVGNCDSGYSCAYMRNISWASPTSPLAKETNPQAAFDRLFQGEDAALSESERLRRRARRLSVLDAVREDAARLRLALGPDDRRKIDEYLTGVRELELRLEATSQATCERAEPGAPNDLRERVEGMVDVIVTAFRCDLTRVVTFMAANGGTNKTYPWLGVTESHHPLSHHQQDPAKLAALEAINAWEIAMFADLAAKLRAIYEPGGSLLDSSILFFSSEIEDGDAHRHTNLPVLVAGRGGGVVTPGRHVRYDAEVPIANLFLAFLHAFGIEQAQFGIDGSAPLAL
ncbi:MAG: transcriptional initiation protein Tat [Proteobacteria bacterium]|nr:MAG: transcriptional initiation protein Tat [Pseudomonadota bacterium]